MHITQDHSLETIAKIPHKQCFFTDLLDSIVTNTSQLTANQNIVMEAETIACKFTKLNEKFSDVNNLVCHSRKINDEEMDSIRDKIEEYFQEYINQYPNEVYPKLHMLGCHVADWISLWSYGCGLMGEQGLEGTHKTFNALNRTFGGIPCALE